MDSHSRPSSPVPSPSSSPVTSPPSSPTSTASLPLVATQPRNPNPRAIFQLLLTLTQVFHNPSFTIPLPYPPLSANFPLLAPSEIPLAPLTANLRLEDPSPSEIHIAALTANLLLPNPSTGNNPHGATVHRQSATNRLLYNLARRLLVGNTPNPNPPTAPSSSQDPPQRFTRSAFSREIHEIVIPAATVIGIFTQLSQAIHLVILNMYLQSRVNSRSGSGSGSPSPSQEESDAEAKVQGIIDHFSRTLTLYGIAGYTYLWGRIVLPLVPPRILGYRTYWVTYFVDEMIALPAGMIALVIMNSLVGETFAMWIGIVFAIVFLIRYAAAVGVPLCRSLYRRFHR